jgi:pSer/pThr/pTyr-binding forkhead associated (FHA) protein
MTVCYGCLQPFDDAAFVQAPDTLLSDDGDDELFIEEPQGSSAMDTAATTPATDAPPASPATLSAQARFHVSVSGLFGYDVYLSRAEGSQLTIGCARDNDIVLPHTESKRHLLRLYCSQGLVWAQDRGSKQQALVDGAPLTGARCLRQGTVLEAGNARIELLAG